MCIRDSSKIRVGALGGVDDEILVGSIVGKPVGKEDIEAEGDGDRVRDAEGDSVENESLKQNISARRNFLKIFFNVISSDILNS